MPAGPDRSSRTSRPHTPAALGAARTRSETVVITPSVPSEPTISSRNPGPAALAGIAGKRQVPGRRRHLRSRAPSSRCSRIHSRPVLPICSRRIRPASHTRRTAASAPASAPPPRARALQSRSRACPHRWSRSATPGRARRRAIRHMSREITPACSPRNGSTPPTTLVPPPNGTTASGRCVSTARALPAPAHGWPGSTTASGAPSGEPERMPHEIDVPLAGSVHRPFGMISLAPRPCRRSPRAPPARSRQPGCSAASRHSSATGGRGVPATPTVSGE